jgi:glycosyltransferase involved in cell wall biosynthesis
MPSRTDILALIPAYNEERHVGDVVRRTLPFLPALVIDDGSIDETARAAETAGARVLRQETNGGKGAALARGFREGVAGGYRAVVTLDADGQHRPEEIPRFIDAFDHGLGELVIGYRDFRRMPPARRFGNTTGTWLLSAAIGRRVRDNQSGFRLLAAPLLGALAVTRSGFEMEVEMIVDAVTRGFRIAWVPISTIYGDEESHFRPLRDSVRFLGMVVHAARRRRNSRARNASRQSG